MEQQEQNDKLWDPDACAQYLGCARWTFVNRISKMPNFPKPHVETGRRFRRWRPSDVRDFSTRTGRRGRPN